MQDNYQHGGGSNRAGDREGNLIGWLVFTDETRSAVRVVDRNGEPLLVERTDGGYVVRTATGEVRQPRPATLDDPFYLGVDDDGSVRVYVDGHGKLCVPLEDFERAIGKR
jgi:hypothetical protein